MRTTTCLASGPGFAINDVSIKVDDTSWSEPEAGGSYRLNFVRSGVFRLRLRDWDLVADPAIAYVSGPEDEQCIAHKVGVRDVCTTVALSDDLVGELTDGESATPSEPVFTTGRIDLAHRTMVMRARSGASEFELTERVNMLAVDLFGRQLTRRSRDGAPATVAQRRRLVEAAREALAENSVSLGLGDVARQVGASPHHLSRLFRQETGETLTRFRNRLRVRLALDRLEKGEDNLSRLAVELGFSDHAHLTRTVREEVGCTPSAVRDLFAKPDEQAS